MKINSMAAAPYPETWTDYMTVGELRAWLSDPTLMDGDLTDIVRLRKGVGNFRVECDRHEILEDDYGSQD